MEGSIGPLPYLVLAVGAMLASGAQAGQKVAIRVSGGKFLKAAPDGWLQAVRLLPTHEELFELVPREGGSLSLKAPDGRFVTAEGRQTRLRAGSPRAEPGDRDIFQVVPREGNRVALKVRDDRDFAAWGLSGGPRGGKDAGPVADPKAKLRPDQPGPDQTIEIFHAGEIPAATRAALAAAVRTVVMDELRDKPYDKVRSRKREQFLDLPAPTLRDPTRTRTHRVLSMVEEYHVRAQLDGTPEIEITHMPTLKGYQDKSLAVLMFAVRARLPVQGRVGYKVPNTLSASTGFHTTARLWLVGEVAVQKSGDRLSLSSPRLCEVHVKLDKLRLSNDLLDAARQPIEDLVNHELAHNEDRIRQQANKSLGKAIGSREFQHPLLRYLGLP